MKFGYRNARNTSRWQAITRTNHNDLFSDFMTPIGQRVNTLRPRQNGRHFADDTFKRIFLTENVWISIKISMKFIPKGLINNIPALVQMMAWRRSGDKSLSEPMMVSLPTHICVTRPQWVKLIANTRQNSGECWFLSHTEELSTNLIYNCFKFNQ